MHVLQLSYYWAILLYKVIQLAAKKKTKKIFSVSIALLLALAVGAVWFIGLNQSNTSPNLSDSNWGEGGNSTPSVTATVDASKTVTGIGFVDLGYRSIQTSNPELMITASVESQNAKALQTLNEQLFDAIITTPIEITTDDSLNGSTVTLVRTYTKPLPHNVNASFLYYDEEHDIWVPVPSILSEDRTTLTAEVDHLSWWTDITNGPQQALDTVAKSFDKGIKVVTDASNKVGQWIGDQVTSVSEEGIRLSKTFFGIGGNAPTCNNAIPAWVDSSIKRAETDQFMPMMWCLGAHPNNPEKLEVKVVNNNGFSLRLYSPTNTRPDSIEGITNYQAAIRNTNSIEFFMAKGAVLDDGQELKFTFSENQIGQQAKLRLSTISDINDFIVLGVLQTAAKYAASETIPEVKTFECIEKSVNVASLSFNNDFIHAQTALTSATIDCIPGISNTVGLKKDIAGFLVMTSIQLGSVVLNEGDGEANTITVNSRSNIMGERPIGPLVEPCAAIDFRNSGDGPKSLVFISGPDITCDQGAAIAQRYAAALQGDYDIFKYGGRDAIYEDSESGYGCGLFREFAGEVTVLSGQEAMCSDGNQNKVVVQLHDTVLLPGDIMHSSDFYELKERPFIRFTSPDKSVVCTGKITDEGQIACTGNGPNGGATSAILKAGKPVEYSNTNTPHTFDNYDSLQKGEVVTLWNFACTAPADNQLQCVGAEYGFRLSGDILVPLKVTQ